MTRSEPRPRASLGRVLDDLGATLLDLVHGDAERADEIGGVVIHDPVDDAGAAPRRAGARRRRRRPATRSSRCCGELGRAGAAGLVLRAPVPPTPDGPRRPPTTSGVALLGLSRGAPWAHLAAMLRSLLAEGDVGVAEPGVARRAAVRRPVRGRQRDRRRCSTPRSPSRTAARGCSPSPAARTRPTRRGSRRSSAARCPSATRGSSTSAASSASSTAATSRCSSSPATDGRRLLDAAGGDRRPRRRRGARLDLGRGARPAQRGAHRGAARRRQAGRAAPAAGPRRRRRPAPAARRPAQLRAGGRRRRPRGARPARPRRPAADGARRRRLRTPTRPSTATGADAAHERQRLSDAFAMHLSAVHPRSAAALVGGVAYGLVPAARLGRATARSAPSASPTTSSTGSATGCARVVGVGPVVRRPGRSGRMRAPAPTAPCGCCASGRGERRVARLADIQVEALMLELRDLVAARGDRPTGVARPG